MATLLLAWRTERQPLLILRATRTEESFEFEAKEGR